MGAPGVSALTRYRRLHPSERATVPAAALLLVAARIGLRLTNLPRLRRLAAAWAPRTTVGPERLAQLVGALANTIPGTTCLHRAVALEALLRAAGHAAELRIGVAGRRGQGALDAHAWVELEGAAVAESPSAYAALPVFGTRG